MSNIMFTPTRGIIVNTYQNKPMVSIREFYTKDGKLTPGIKGIAMLPDHFNKLQTSIDKIDAAIKTGNISEPVVSISKKQKVRITSFKGATYVDFREFYEKDGKTLPGKKGIALPLDQWELVKSNIQSAVDEMAKLSV